MSTLSCLLSSGSLSCFDFSVHCLDLFPLLLRKLSSVPQDQKETKRSPLGLGNKFCLQKTEPPKKNKKNHAFFSSSSVSCIVSKNIRLLSVLATRFVSAKSHWGRLRLEKLQTKVASCKPKKFRV